MCSVLLKTVVLELPSFTQIGTAEVHEDADEVHNSILIQNKIMGIDYLAPLALYTNVERYSHVISYSKNGQSMYTTLTTARRRVRATAGNVVRHATFQIAKTHVYICSRDVVVDDELLLVYPFHYWHGLYGERGHSYSFHVSECRPHEYIMQLVGKDRDTQTRIERMLLDDIPNAYDNTVVETEAAL